MDIMAMDFHIMDIMGSVLLSLVMVVMVTMESERLSPAMDIMAMVTMESERLNPVMDIMAMDFHIMDIMGSVLLSLVTVDMVTMESERLNLAMDITVMDFHITEAT